MKTGQTQKLAAYFKAHPNTVIPAVKLHQVASGKRNGYAASLSRRISDLRKSGLAIVKVMDFYVRIGGQYQRRTGYSFIP